ncbi:MAG: class I SAM-dependent methyltransferase [Gammaproteobacteria bacterium]|nr:class I SAM-dependent methyltransferase [Gammaproteobacteria bacterium]
MDNYEAATYGDAIAGAYDRLYGGRPDAEHAAASLSGMAAGGRALELGIGTGRMAIPLAACGVEVHGIDASEAMIRHLRGKAAATGIHAVVGDFADLAMDTKFELIYAVFSSFFGLTTQEAQVTCFRRVAEHLTDAGVFVFEAFVPDPSRYAQGRYVGVTHVEEDFAGVDLSLHDIVNQTVSTQHVLMETSGTRLFPSLIRYAWPSELDLMARLAGLRLRDRWSDWSRSPFTSASRNHVSVYERATT